MRTYCLHFAGEREQIVPKIEAVAALYSDHGSSVKDHGAKNSPAKATFYEKIVLRSREGSFEMRYHICRRQI